MDNMEIQENDNTIETTTSKLYKDLASLYLNQRFSDITFIVHGQKVFAHKVILAIRSPYFEKMLFGSLTEAKQDEIILNDLCFNAFKKLLKYIYTDQITVIAANLELSLKVLDLANKFCISDLETVIADELIGVIDDDNVLQIIQKAELYSLSELLEECFSFIEEQAEEFLQGEEYKKYPQEMLIRILKRDTFSAPEIDIFKAVAEWYNANEKENDDLLDCVRFASLTTEDIYSIVKPSNLIDAETLNNILGEIMGVYPRTSTSRCVTVHNVNVASVERKARMLYNFSMLSNTCEDKFSCCPIGDREGFTVELGQPTYINNIKMLLHIGVGLKYYRYYIESSIDQKIWTRIVDCTNSDCRGLQEWYFEALVVQYIRVVGTYCCAGVTLDIVSFEAYSQECLPPTSNIANLRNHATIVEGDGNGMLGNFKTQCTSHEISEEGNIVIQFAQPYTIDRIRLHLQDVDERKYRYYIESSINRSDWALLVDKRNEDCHSWQILEFFPRSIVYLKITGTYRSDGFPWFRCRRIKCYPSSLLLVRTKLSKLIVGSSSDPKI